MATSHEKPIPSCLGGNFKSRLDVLRSTLSIELPRKAVADIILIVEGRWHFHGLFLSPCFMNLHSRLKLGDDLSAPLGKEAARNKPRLRECNFHIGYLVDGIAHAREKLHNLIVLIGARQLALGREMGGVLLSVLALESEGKPLIFLNKEKASMDLPDGCGTGKEALPRLVETAEKGHALTERRGHVLGKEMVALHSVHTKAAKMPFRIGVAETVSIGKRSSASHHDAVAPNVLDHAHFLTFALGGIESCHIACPAMKEILCETSGKTSGRVGVEREGLMTERGSLILGTTTENGIEPTTIESGDILHIGHILEPPLYLEGTNSRIHHLLQGGTAVHVTERKKVALLLDDVPLCIFQREGKAAELCTLASVGRASETVL